MFDSRVEPDNSKVHEEALVLVAKYPGDYTVDQICSIYEYLKDGWHYVGDPRGVNNFFYANETLNVGKEANCAGVGDCGDFAILMSALVESIGGTTRIILASNNTTGGHAYTEVYLGQINDPNSQVDAIINWLKQDFETEKIFVNINTSTKEVWLNLDWWPDQAGNPHPGGPFFTGDKNIVLHVREKYKKVPLRLPEKANKPPKLISLTSDKPSPQDEGTIVTWNAKAKDSDNDQILYRFFLNDDPVTKWITDNTWVWNTNDTDVGENQIEVHVRDGKHAGPDGFDDHKVDSFNITTPETRSIAATKVIKPSPIAINETHVGNAPTQLYNVSLDQITMILYVHEGSTSGPIIPGAQVTSNDNSGNSFQGTTNAKGYVTITGTPGTWSFTASADGYEDKPWNQQITSTCKKDAFLLKVVTQPSATIPQQANHKPITLILYVNEGNQNGPAIINAQVTGQDGSGESFQHNTDDRGSVIITGNPGTWSFSASASGYETNNWSQPISDTCAKHAFLQKIKKPNVATATQEMCTEYPDKCLVFVYGNKPEEAQTCYESEVDCLDQALSQNQNNSEYWYDKGNALHMLNRYDDAIKALDRATELDPQLKYAWNEKGVIFKQQGKTYEANKCFNKAMEIDPSWSVPRDNLAG